MDKNETTTLTYTLKYAEGTTQYFAEIGGKYYEITMGNNGIKVNTEPSNIGEPETPPVPTISTNKDGIITTELGENGTITINSGESYGEVEITITCSGKETSCTVTIQAPPPSAGIPETPRETAKEIPYDWEEIEKLAELISSKTDEITDDTEEVAVSINAKSDTLRVGDTAKVDGKVVRILGFNHDELSDEEKETAYGGGRSQAGISFEYVDDLMRSPIEPNYNDMSRGGWGACPLRGTLNNTTINNISIKDRIKEVKKEYIQTYNNAGSKTTSNDKLWLLSCGEIWNNGYGGGETRGQAVATEGKQYKYYKKINANHNINNNALKKPSKYVGAAVDAEDWWLRSPHHEGNFLSVRRFRCMSV